MKRILLKVADKYVVRGVTRNPNVTTYVECVYKWSNTYITRKSITYAYTVAGIFKEKTWNQVKETAISNYKQLMTN